MSYSKLLRLSSINDDVFGMLVTFFGGDAERIAEATVLGVLIFGN